jgi:hypothetical protein
LTTTTTTTTTTTMSLLTTPTPTPTISKELQTIEDALKSIIVVFNEREYDDYLPLKMFEGDISDQILPLIIDICCVEVKQERHCHCGRDGTPHYSTELEKKTLKSETGEEISVAVMVYHEWLTYSWGVPDCDHFGYDDVLMIYKEFIQVFYPSLCK